MAEKRSSDRTGIRAAARQLFGTVRDARKRIAWKRANVASNHGRIWMIAGFPHHLAKKQIDCLEHRLSPIGQRQCVSLATESPLNLLRRIRCRPELIGVQSHWDVSKADLLEPFAWVRKHHPQARIVYFDWFAPTDLRHCWVFDHVDLYVKKHVLRDRTAYERGFADTNLVEYEAKNYGPRMFGTPHRGISRAVLNDRLFAGWNFGASPAMAGMLRHRWHENRDRSIDLHCRIGTYGIKGHWYSNLRQRCYDAAKAAATSASLVDTLKVRRPVYLHELTHSRICFSPFGFGEVCLRDFEAIACGAVLLKQDMSHLETWPDIYRPYETYVPVRWDLADFSDKCKWLRADNERCKEIAGNALRAWQSYIDRGWCEQLARFRHKVRLPLITDEDAIADAREQAAARVNK